MTAQASLRVTDRNETIVRRGADVIRIEAEALAGLADAMPTGFADACGAIMGAVGRVVITGMGKSGHIGRKMAATFAATGTPATYVHPAEAAHGDLGMVTPDDVLIVISNSGNTAELRPILKYAESIAVTVIGIASQRDSLVMEHATIQLDTPVCREACPANIAPTTSTTVQLALGDALAMAVMDMRGFSRDGMKALHPGGSIGLRLMPVCEIMQGSGRLPLVLPETPMRDVISTITSMGYGIAGVTDTMGRLIGVITDGDIRRHFDELVSATAEQVMTRNPKTVQADALAEDALQFLNDAKITCAFVLPNTADLNHPAKPVGVVHIHDFLRIGLH